MMSSCPPAIICVLEKVLTRLEFYGRVFFVSRYEKNCPETAKKKVSIQLFFRLSYIKFFIRISSTHNIILQKEGGEYRIKKSWTLLRTGRQLSSPIRFNARFYYASFLCPRVYYEYILHVCMRFFIFLHRLCESMLMLYYFIYRYSHRCITGGGGDGVADVNNILFLVPSSSFTITQQHYSFLES